MVVLFRQGASRHAFWAYNLMLPAAFAVALAYAKLPRVSTMLVAAQAVLCFTWSALRLSVEHEQNQLGLVAAALPRETEVPVVSPRSFHPYVSWYAHSRPITVRTAAELRALPRSSVALVDTEHARALGCTPPLGPRWQVVTLETCELVAASR